MSDDRRAGHLPEHGDALPTPERERRIERGVMASIDGRRARRTQLIQVAAVLVLVVGGGGLLVGVLHGAGTTASSGAGSAAGGSVEAAVVRCAPTAGGDTGQTLEVRVPKASLPDGAIAACGGRAVDLQPARGTGTTDGSTDGTTAGTTDGTTAGTTDGTTTPSRAASAAPSSISPSPSPTATFGSSTAGSSAAGSSRPRAVLCTDVDGALVVLPFQGSAIATCVRAGMEPSAP